MLLLLVLIGLFALLCLIMGFWTLKRKRLIDDVPTSKTQGVFIGLSELKGTAESDTPLSSYLAGVRCVQYAWTVDEHWSRIVHETYTDSKGHRQTRTRTESGWTTVARGGQSIPFYLKDDTGIVRIVPEGATINSVKTFNETCSPGNPLYFDKGPATQIAHSTHERRFNETALPLHTMLYVIGQARERQDIAAAEIARDKNVKMFLISTRTEKQISSRHAWLFWLWIIFGLAAVTGGAVGWDIMAGISVGLGEALAVTVGGFIIALSLGWLWTVYNSLVNLHHMVEQAWSQVDVQLKRRYDLITNLENAVKGYLAHERETQQLLTELRAQSEATPPGVAGPDFKGISPVLRMTVERYPELKASKTFLGLQQALVDAEQRIALARDYFNNSATYHNTRLSIIPDRFVAALVRLRPKDLMAAADFERAPVEIKLAD